MMGGGCQPGRSGSKQGDVGRVRGVSDRTTTREAPRLLHLVIGCSASIGLAAMALHCGATSGGDDAAGSGEQGGGGPGSGGAQSSGTQSGAGGNLTIDVQTQDYSIDQFFEDDPPPMSCDGGGQAPDPPGGTPECPDDKNLEGCPCSAQGVTEPCWPGKRKNRNRGICHDGTTTCQLTGESDLKWGPCVGAQLPTGDSGKQACLCFSGGHWALENTSPCFVTGGGVGAVAVSTIVQNGQSQCPPINPLVLPSQPWSKNTLKVDCTGYFKLCFSIKAGDGNDPKPTDCEIVEVCTEAHYAPANTVVSFPDLPAWMTDQQKSACVQSFIDGGGYGEMSVVGQSDECEQVDKVFNRVIYCPLACSQPNPPEMCKQCMQGGGGDF